jgi:cytochrome c-type biogenesis protein CcmH
MNAVFLTSTFLMLLIAMSFATVPLLHGKKHPTRNVVKAPLLVVLGALLLAVGLYAAIGRPGVASVASVQDTSGAPLPGPDANEERKAASVNELLAGLEQHLQAEPDDAKGWLLLAKSYDHLGRRKDAAAAYDKAVKLGLSDNVMEAQLR